MDFVIDEMRAKLRDYWYDESQSPVIQVSAVLDQLRKTTVSTQGRGETRKNFNSYEASK